MIPSRSLALLAARSSSARALRLWPAGAHVATRRTDDGLMRWRAGQRIWETTTATHLSEGDAAGQKQDSSPSEEKESGRFDVKPNESILFFDSETL